MNFLTLYGDTEGPLGLPMKDAQAKALAVLLEQLPAELREPVRLETAKATTEVMDGERADVSWISTEAVDRYREVVLAAGLDDSHFKLNPIVTLGHCYWSPPVGRSLWRKKVRDGDRRGVKAKTVYPTRPAGTPADSPWHPDDAFALVQAQLMNGKSIGFLPLEVREPTAKERESGWTDVRRVIVRWLLLEYACTWLPVNQEAITESVSKSLAALGLPLPVDPPAPPPAPAPVAVVPFIPWPEVEKAVTTRISGLDVAGMVDRALAAALDKHRGRV